MVGVEYIVYKKENCWQIRGEWDNIRRAHKILQKLTTEDGYQTHRERELTRLAEEERAAEERRAVQVGRLAAKRLRQAKLPGPESGCGRAGLRPRAHMKPLPREDDYSSDNNDVNEKDTESDLEEVLIKKEPDEEPNMLKDDDSCIQSLKECRTEQFEPSSCMAPDNATPDVARTLDINAVNALAASFAEETVVMESSKNNLLQDPKIDGSETSYINEESYMDKIEGDDFLSKGERPLQISENVPVEKGGFQGRTANRRKPQNPVRIEETPESAYEEEGRSQDEDVEQVKEEEDEDGDVTDEENCEEAEDDSDWDVEALVKKGRDSVRQKQCIFSCDLCGFTSRNRDSIRDHKKRNHMEKKLKCPECGKAYGVRRDLRKHIKTHSIQYPCKICGKTYKEERNYRNHIKTHENDYIRPSWPCDQCEKRFSTKYVLQVHKDQVHQGHMPEWLCPVCGKNFKQKHSLVEHQLIHTGERPFACKICAKTFRHRTTCRKHEMLHTDIRLFTCEICGKDFKQRNSLKIHAVVHTRERNHQCSVCNKMFTQKQALIRHYRIHSGEKPFMCELCGDRFNDTSILRRHMMGIHKMELKSAIQHFVLPAGHYHDQQKPPTSSNYQPHSDPSDSQENDHTREPLNEKSSDVCVYGQSEQSDGPVTGGHHGNHDLVHQRELYSQGVQMSPVCPSRAQLASGSQPGTPSAVNSVSQGATSTSPQGATSTAGQSLPPLPAISQGTTSTSGQGLPPLPALGAVAFPGMTSDLQPLDPRMAAVMGGMPYPNINSSPNSGDLAYLQATQHMSAYNNYQRLY